MEPEIQRAVETVMALDPTRPAMIDGGDALRDKSLPVYGNHYNEANFRHYPDEAYTMKLAFSRHKEPRAGPVAASATTSRCSWARASSPTAVPPSAYAALIGEAAFLGWTAARPGVGLFAKMLAEGYRWHGVAGFHFWFGSDRADLHYNAFQPVCVLCREWNWTFAGGQEVKRTLKVFNDTRFDDADRRSTWSVPRRRQGRRPRAGKTFAPRPGDGEGVRRRLHAPTVDGAHRPANWC